MTTENFIPQLTADGSFTFFSEEFNELYHSHFGARQESFQKFVVPTQLESQAKKPVLRLLDICYGLGYNTAAALQTIWTINPHCYVEIIGLELNSTVPKAALTHHLFDSWSSEYTNILVTLANSHYAQGDNFQATLIIGDARTTIQQVKLSGFEADAIFLDPFSPPQCPQLWTIEFINLVSKCLHITGLLATYSCAASVHTALLTAGLLIASTPPIGRKTPGTVAIRKGDLPPLCQEEVEHLQTRAAIPYRDSQLCDSASVILERRQVEQQMCSLEPTSRWRKRWSKINSKTYV